MSNTTSPGDAVTVRVVVAGSVRADLPLLVGLAEEEFERLGVSGTVVVVDDAPAVRAQFAPDTATVVLPGADPRLRALMTVAGPHAAATVWYDIELTGPVPVAAGAAHLYGRGVWGLVWAIRHAVLRVRHPATRIAYGPDSEQCGWLHLPAASVPVPVAVLLHGGFWRSAWAADVMEALAVDLVARGFAVWNLEYRRPDRHGWAATAADVAAGFAALSDVDAPLALDRVAVLGHSAGGQLALRLAAEAGFGRVALAVSMAGVLDLAGGDERAISNGAVAVALGGPRDEVADVYEVSDPMSRVPLGVPQLVVQGADDDLDLIDFNRRYVAAARAAGDDVRYLEEPGDHFAVIDPAAPLWHATVEALVDGLEMPRKVT